jgi:hypothetical protein
MCISLARVRGMATLGISTNTRLLATAIIHSGRLLDYSIHLHKQPWSPSKANLIINSLEPCVRRYCIKSVVLSIPHEYYQTKALQYLFSRICRHFKKKGITVINQEVKAFYSICPPEQKKTKKALMETIVKLFPELNYCYYKELRNKSKYYIKLFEAVAAAAVHDVQ